MFPTQIYNLNNEEGFLLHLGITSYIAFFQDFPDEEDASVKDVTAWFRKPFSAIALSNGLVPQILTWGMVESVHSFSQMGWTKGCGMDFREVLKIGFEQKTYDEIYMAYRRYFEGLKGEKK